MLATVHLLVGAAIGKYLSGSWPLAFGISFLSHFLLDALPHTDAGTLKRPEERGTITLTDLVLVLIDVAVAAGVLLWLSGRPEFSTSVLAGAFGGIAPDFVHPAFHAIPALRAFPATSWYYHFHRRIQGTVDKKDWLYGLAIELVVAALSIALFFL